MAVELRCPECRAKLRLPQAPEADSEIECPKCGHVFPTDENVVHAGGEDEDEKASKKPAGDEKPKKSKKKKNKDESKTKAADPKAADPNKPFKRKKRRAKKKTTNPVLLWSIVGVGSFLLISMIAVMTWWYTRKTPSQEMMSYLPEDCDEVIGINLGHLQKYPEFYKSCESTFGTKGFKAAADVFSKALGSDTNTIVEYIMQGTGKGSPDVEATIIRTKDEFDPSLLKNIEGAQEGTVNGVKYFAIPEIPELKYPNLRVFAPTNRIVVFCRGDIPDAKFRAMVVGNKDSENTIYYRAGPLIKGVTRGTVWRLVVYGNGYSPPEPPPAAKAGVQENEEDNLKKEIADILKGSKGMGYKASVGSREVRGEWVVWFKDSDAASTLAKKWKDREWIKDDEKPPPRWWKTLSGKSGGGKTAENALKDGLSFRTSGETFIVRTSLETKVLTVSQLVSAFTDKGGAAGMGMPGMPGGGGMPGKGPGMPGKGPGGPGGPGGMQPPGGGTGAPTPPGSGPGGTGTPAPPGKMPRRRFVRRHVRSRVSTIVL